MQELLETWRCATAAGRRPSWYSIRPAKGVLVEEVEEENEEYKEDKKDEEAYKEDKYEEEDKED